MKQSNRTTSKKLKFKKRITVDSEPHIIKAKSGWWSGAEDFGMGVAEVSGLGALSGALTGKTFADNVGYNYNTSQGQGFNSAMTGIAGTEKQIAPMVAGAAATAYSGPVAGQAAQMGTSMLQQGISNEQSAYQKGKQGTQYNPGVTNNSYGAQPQFDLGGQPSAPQIEVQGDELETQNGKITQDFKKFPKHTKGGYTYSPKPNRVIIPSKMRDKYLEATKQGRNDMETNLIHDQMVREQQDNQQQEQETMKAKGGSTSIHIKPSHKGRFTAYKERTGKTTSEALHSSNPHVRQMANFARNAAKWHKREDGGLTQNNPQNNQSVDSAQQRGQFPVDISGFNKSNNPFAINFPYGTNQSIINDYPKTAKWTQNPNMPEEFLDPSTGFSGAYHPTLMPQKFQIDNPNVQQNVTNNRMNAPTGNGFIPAISHKDGGLTYQNGGRTAWMLARKQGGSTNLSTKLKAYQYATNSHIPKAEDGYSTYFGGQGNPLTGLNVGQLNAFQDQNNNTQFNNQRLNNAGIATFSGQPSSVDDNFFGNNFNSFNQSQNASMGTYQSPIEQQRQGLTSDKQNAWKQFNSSPYSDPGQQQPSNTIQTNKNLNFGNSGMENARNAGYYGALAAPIAYNLYRGMQKPQTLNQQDFQNPEYNRIKSLMANRSINMKPVSDEIRDSYRVGLANIGSGTKSSGQVLSGQTSLWASRMNALANANMNAQNYNNGYRGEEASTLAGIGDSYANRKLGIQDINDQNRARRNSFMASGLSQSSQLAQGLNKDDILYHLANQAYPDYGYNRPYGEDRGFQYRKRYTGGDNQSSGYYNENYR